MAPVRLFRFTLRTALSLALLAGVLGPLAPSARAQSAALVGTEERVKAAYLYRLLNYVEFPAHSAAPYVVGVLEDEIVAAELSQLVAGKQVNGRDVVVRKLAAGSPPAGLDVLFVGRSERARQGAFLKQLRSAPVLTVTETPDGLEQGSIMNFRIVDNHVRFEISLPAADKAGLRLSSRLLALAVKIVKEQ